MADAAKSKSFVPHAADRTNFPNLIGSSHQTRNIPFLRDFCHAKIGVILVNKMKQNWNLMFRLAFQYGLGNKHVRKEILTGKYQTAQSLLL